MGAKLVKGKTNPLRKKEDVDSPGAGFPDSFQFLHFFLEVQRCAGSEEGVASFLFDSISKVVNSPPSPLGERQWLKE